MLGVSKQALYNREKYLIKEGIETAIVLEKVKYIKQKLPMTGGRKLKYMLERRKINVGRDRLFNILRENKLLVRRKRRFARTTFSNHWLRKHKDIYKNYKVEKPEQVFVSDITYIRVKEGFNYLSLVTDAYSKRIMGSRLSKDLTKEGTVAALKQAIDSRAFNHSLMHHSDRGFQYCCKDYIDLLESNNIAVSMTQSGSPYDNAIAERVNGILKHELGLDKTFEDHEQAIKAVDLAVSRYNKIRPHMSCGYLTPNQTHKSKQPIKRLWKKKKYRNYNTEIGNNFLESQILITNPILNNKIEIK